MKKLVLLLLTLVTIHANELTTDSFNFRINYGFGDHTSDFSKQEKSFVDFYDISRSLTNPKTNQVEEIDINYSYQRRFFSSELLYYPWNNIGIGINYQLSQVYQRFKFPKDFSSYENEARFLNQNLIGPVLDIWLLSVQKLGISISACPYYTKGTLNRVAVLNREYKEEDDFNDMLKEYNREIDVNGFGGAIYLHLLAFTSEKMYISFQVDYNYTSTDISNDYFTGYIRNSKNSSNGFSMGVGFLIN